MTQETILNAITNNDLDAIKKMHANKEDLNISLNNIGRNAIHIAARYNRPEIVEYLIDNNLTQKNALDADGNTGLNIAANFGHLEVSKVLVNKGLNLNHQNRGGKTPLIMGANKNYNLQLFLISSGADTTIKDKENKSINDYMTDKVLESNTQNYSKNINDLKSILTPSILPETNPQNNTAVKTENTPETTENLDDLSQPELIKKLIDMGFSNLSESTEKYIGRDHEIATLKGFITKKQNVVLVGQPGVGKTSTINKLAEEIKEDGKIILQIPTLMIKGDKYQNSTSNKINSWTKIATKLYPNVVFYIDEMAFLSGNTNNSDASESPAQIIKEYLDDVGNDRIQLIGSLSPQEYKKMLETDETFLTTFQSGTSGGFELESMPLKDITAIMLDDSTINKLIDKNSFNIVNNEHYKDVMTYGLDLLDTYIFNQTFPLKAMDFTKSLLSKYDSEKLTHEIVLEEFSKKYNIPVEFITHEIEEGSKFANIDKILKETLYGQDEMINIISTKIKGDIISRNPDVHKPLSFIFMGPTGVGKTEATVILEKHLNYPRTEIRLGELKTAADMPILLDKLREFVTENYSGIIVFDELEKANPQLLDVLLGILDRGKFGSGKDEVTCGNIIFVATTNVAVEEMSATKEKQKELYGETALDESVLREWLKSYNIRAEIIGRISKIVDFNPLTKDIILKIASKYAETKVKDYAEQGVTLIIDESFIETQIKHQFGDSLKAREGAREIRNTINNALDKVITDNEVLIHKKKGNTIHITQAKESDDIGIIVTKKDNTQYKTTVKDNANLSKQKTENALNAIIEAAQAIDTQRPKLNPSGKTLTGAVGKV